MARELELKPMYQCGECDILFFQFTTTELVGEVHYLCPNPNCHAPINLCDPVVNEAILLYFIHIIAESNIPWQRRKNLREIAESQMGPWNDLYRLL